MNSPVVKFSLAMAAILLGTVAFIFSIIRLIGNKPMLTLSNEGILDKSSILKYGLIPWTNILGCKIITIQRQKLVALILHDNKAFIDNLTGYTRIAANWNLRRYGTPVMISAISLQITPEELREHINKIVKK